MTGHAVDRAARTLAQAFGYGGSWFTADYQFGKAQAWTPTNATTGDGDENMPAAIAGLAICRRTETLERADKAAGIHEFHHWKRCKGIAVMPRVRPHPNALGALAFAKLDGPLEDWLLLYALQDWHRWPRVRRYAIACRPDPDAVDDAAQRILFRRAATSQDDRAKQLGVRAMDYRERTRTAERMLRAWLERAAIGYLSALDGFTP